MYSIHHYLFAAMWLAWAIYWKVSAKHAKTTARREAFASRMFVLAAFSVAAALLLLPSLPGTALDARFLPAGSAPFWIGAAVTAAGLLFSAWARRLLGANWSGSVAIMERHELIQSGPYSRIRHPIYTGMLLAFAGSAIALGQWRGVLAVVLVAVALWRKLRIEEAWLLREFGEAYADYRRRTSALVPVLL